MNSLIRKAFFLYLIFLLPCGSRSNSYDTAFEGLIQRLVDDGQDSSYVRQLFCDQRVQFIEELIPLNMIPKENREAYSGFLEKAQINDGIKFLQRWERDLEKALDGSDVPMEIAVAILKIESDLGRRPGDRPVFCLNVLIKLFMLENPHLYAISVIDISCCIIFIAAPVLY